MHLYRIMQERERNMYDYDLASGMYHDDGMQRDRSGSFNATIHNVFRVMNSILHECCSDKSCVRESSRSCWR